MKGRRELRVRGGERERTRVRRAGAAVAEAVARIYNEGIDDRLATFETRWRGAGDVLEWLADGFPVVVAELDGEVVAWASAPPYRLRDCYSGVRELSIYVARATAAATASEEPRSRR